MSRSGRLLEMVTILGGRRPRSLQEMVERFEVSERTIYRDLAELSSRRIPVTRDEAGYRLLEGTTLRPLNLTAAERAVLRLALDNPAIRRQPALAKTLELLEAKLDAVSRRTEESHRALAEAGPERSGPVAPEIFAELERAANERRTIEIEYASLSGGENRWRRVDPYRLFHRGEAWYLVGHCHVNAEPRIFRIDRIGAVRPCDERFSAPDFDLDGYLSDTWTIFRGDKLHDVVLHFDPALAPLVLNARHHPDEEVAERLDGTVEYRVRVSHLDEVARWVVGFGGRCQVVRPEGLVRGVRKLASGVLRTRESNG